mgnify:CR=1 FL=1
MNPFNRPFSKRTLPQMGLAKLPQLIDLDMTTRNRLYYVINDWNVLVRQNDKPYTERLNDILWPKLKRVKGIAEEKHPSATSEKMKYYLEHASIWDYIDVIEFIAHLLCVFEARREIVEPKGVGLAGGFAGEVNNIFETENVKYRIELEDNTYLAKRYDSQFTNEEIIKKGELLLENPKYSSAQIFFQRALEKNKGGDWKGAITNANSAFESYLKAHVQKNTATENLLSEFFKYRVNGKLIIPSYLNDKIIQLKKILEIPSVIANNDGDKHGNVEWPKDDPGLSSLVINLTATFIIFFEEKINLSVENTS